MGVVSQLSEKVLPFGIPLRFDFPPTHLIEAPPAGAFDVEDLERRTRRLEKLENLYHKGQDAAWDQVRYRGGRSGVLRRPGAERLRLD